MDMQFRGAIIGFGHIAANGHVPAYKTNPKIEICAVCDSCPERRQVNERLLPQSRFYQSVEELFQREDMDFIDVATPPALHAQYILMALSSQKHVLCEKPLVLRAEDLLNIWKMMEETRRTVVTVHNWRYSPIMQQISHVIQQGRLGQIRNIEYQVIRTKPSIAVGEDNVDKNWRLNPKIAGGGILVDHGWHAFYLVNQWVGQVPSKVECDLSNRKFKSMPVEDTATVHLHYPSRAKVELFFTWAGQKRYNTITIYGEKGRLLCLDDHIKIYDGEGETEIRFNEALSAGSHHPEWYVAVIEEFLREISEQRFWGNNFREAATCFNILEHCRMSHRLGTPVDITHWKGAC